MPASKPNAGKTTRLACEILKLTRNEWMTAREIGDAMGYDYITAVRDRVQALWDSGLLTVRTRARPSGGGSPAREYRVAPEWRNE